MGNFVHFFLFFPISFSLKPLTRNRSNTMVNYVLKSECDDISTTWHYYYLIKTLTHQLFKELSYISRLLNLIQLFIFFQSYSTYFQIFFLNHRKTNYSSIATTCQRSLFCYRVIISVYIPEESSVSHEDPHSREVVICINIDLHESV